MKIPIHVNKYQISQVGFMDKSTVINVNESVTEQTGKSMEQWLLRIVVMYLLFGDKAMGMI